MLNAICTHPHSQPTTNNQHNYNHNHLNDDYDLYINFYKLNHRTSWYPGRRSGFCDLTIKAVVISLIETPLFQETLAAAMFQSEFFSIKLIFNPWLHLKPGLTSIIITHQQNVGGATYATGNASTKAVDGRGICHVSP